MSVRTIVAQYRAVYAPSGSVAFSASGFVARVPASMYPIAIVLIVSARSGNYGSGGLVGGAYVFGEAIGAPIGAILVDRFSQRRMLLTYLIGHVAAVSLMAVLLEAHAGRTVLLAPAALMGATYLNIGALVRARWSTIWAGVDAERARAYSVESTLDELIYVVGPLVATALATGASPVVTLAIALSLVLIGSVWLAAQRHTEPTSAVRPVGQRRQSALSHKGMVNIVGLMVAMGSVFGSVEVTMIAFCGQHGHRAAAGWVVAAFAAGSGLAGLAYGARQWRRSLVQRLAVSAVVFGLLSLLLLAAANVPTLAVIAFVVGGGVAPTLIGGFGLVDSLVPAGELTEGLTWVSTGIAVGYGLGASIVGGIADRHGAHLAFLVPCGCALVVAAFAVALATRLNKVVDPVERGVTAVGRR